MKKDPTLEETALATIEECSMVAGGERVVVAVSGGPDSTALLLFLAGIRARMGLELTVFHLEHGLRGEESRQDAQFVRSLAERLGLDAEVAEADVRAETADLDRSPQDAARLVRLRRLDEFAGKVGADRVATGHTADDQVETFLMRVVQGAGLTGLSGIAPVSGRTVRPLIRVWRGQVDEYCRRMGVTPRLDSSNLSEQYLRNRVRLKVVPLLVSEFGPGVKEVILREVESLSLDRDFLAGEVVHAFSEVGEVRGEEVVLDRELMLKLPEALQRGVVRMAWEELHPSGEGILQQNLPYRLVLDVLARVVEGKSGARLDLPRGVVAEREYGLVVLRRRPGEPPAPVALDVPGEARLWDGTVLEAALVPRSEVAFGADPFLEFTRPDLGPGLQVRVPGPSDRFHPIGAPAGKKLKDFLSDVKMPRGERERCPVLAQGDEVVWVVGHRLDARFGLRPDDEEAVRLRLRTPANNIQRGLENPDPPE
ncbi:MAG: tRNA lysidine(34) synthetase TilS [Actinobacteria bacterium]|nr:tRNA lysidine(34) synthetase TilS [Actinomycetota bacterium]MBU1942313.1 tRNA lysidine(34) synthetase TilS [Actinomycetota bacterium]